MRSLINQVMPGRFEVDSPISGRRVGLVALVSGLAGFLLGLVYGNWQVAVEPAQVVAGLVEYPAQNHFYLYQTNSWTILHQILAAGLRLGISEGVLSLLLSGLTGMVSFQALALVAFALSRDPLLSVATPFLIMNFLGDRWAGVTYTVYLMGTTHTYGALGLAFMLLVVAVLANGRHRVGGVLLGIAPAVHPSLGLWLGLMMLIALVWDFRYLRTIFFGKAFKYILLGGVVTAISLGISLIISQNVPEITGALKTEYFSTFIRYWDNHRRTFEVFSGTTSVISIGFAISLLWLLLFKHDLPRDSRLLLLAFVASVLLGGGFSILHWLPPERVPEVLLVLMPARLLNFINLASLALVLGLFGRYRDNQWVQFALPVFLLMMLVGAPGYSPLLLLGGLVLVFSASAKRKEQRLLGVLVGIYLVVWGLGLLSGESKNPVILGRYSLARFAAVVIYLGLGSLILILLVPVIGRIVGELQRRMPVPGVRSLLDKLDVPVALRAVVLSVIGLVLILTLGSMYSRWQNERPSFEDRNNDPVLALASQGSGMLLTCSNMHLVQLRTRRAVLLDGGGLDYIPWMPEVAPNMDRVLKELYGVELLNPPDDIKEGRLGALAPETGKELWESRTLEEWSKLGKQFGATEVLCYSDWNLQLPSLARHEGLVLYAIR